MKPLKHQTLKDKKLKKYCDICGVEEVYINRSCRKCNKPKIKYKSCYGDKEIINKFDEVDNYEVGYKFINDCYEWEIDTIKKGIKNLYSCKRMQKNNTILYETFDCFQIRGKVK